MYLSDHFIGSSHEAILPSRGTSDGSASSGVTFKTFVIIAMTLIWASYTLMIRYTRSTTPPDDMYASTTVVSAACVCRATRSCEILGHRAAADDERRANIRKCVVLSLQVLLSECTKFSLSLLFFWRDQKYSIGATKFVLLKFLFSRVRSTVSQWSLTDRPLGLCHVVA